MLSTCVRSPDLLGGRPTAIVPAPARGDHRHELDNRVNVVSSRLLGEGRLCEGVNVLLGKSETVKRLFVKLDRFGDSENAATISAIGMVTLDKDEYPMFLTSLDGNPHRFAFRERAGDKVGGAGSCNLARVSTNTVKADPLFGGAGRENENFTGFGRARVK
jgi:hypothetical protein